MIKKILTNSTLLIIGSLFITGCSFHSNNLKINKLHNVVEKKVQVSSVFLNSYSELKSGGEIIGLDDGYKEYRTKLETTTKNGKVIDRENVWFWFSKPALNEEVYVGLYQISWNKFYNDPRFKHLEIGKTINQTNFLITKYREALKECYYDNRCAITKLETDKTYLIQSSREFEIMEKEINKLESLEIQNSNRKNKIKFIKSFENKEKVNLNKEKLKIKEKELKDKKNKEELNKILGLN